MENEGMYDLLTHLLPPKLKALVSHQTVARDLRILHATLDKKLQTLILTNSSRFSIASDLGSTKNMVHGFCGLTVTFINKNWVLHEHVLDLIPLDGDHSGDAVGKLIYTALKNHGDRTSPLKITGTLGLAPPIAKTDLYESTRKFPLAYDPSQDPEVVEEMEQMERDIKSGELEKDIEDVEDENQSDSDLSDVESDADESLWVEEEEETSEAEDVPKIKAKKVKKAKPTNVFTAVDKIHATVIHILSSEIRCKKARILIHKKCEKKYRHLVFVRSMVIRWNTMFVEMKHAHNLQPALDVFVSDMGRGLAGKAKAAALANKKKWEMCSADWEFIERLMSALEVLQEVTLE
ncbi:hypothetical protein B0H10DRAFT_2209517 [Mycena sp. CBHHK59/15]|nr:hypothetical protein B0H10DRAFT_2209517 [Mycena sp. CBHHK59/15]